MNPYKIENKLDINNPDRVCRHGKAFGGCGQSRRDKSLTPNNSVDIVLGAKAPIRAKALAAKAAKPGKS